eukprot:6490355-Amphidinium_carterae.1
MQRHTNNCVIPLEMCRVVLLILLVFSCKVKSRTKRTRGKGGLWRAAVHVQRKGLKGSACPTFRQVAMNLKQMKEANDPALARIEELGKTATIAGRCVRSGQSAFGPTSRQVSRQVQTLARQGMWQVTRAMPASQRAELLASKTFLQLDALQDALSEARQMVRFDGHAKKESHKQMVDTLQKWQGTLGKQHVKDLVGLLPTLSLDLHALQPVPSIFGPCFKLHSMPDDLATKAAGWASQTCAALPAPLVADHRECLRAGHCLHSVDGQLLLALQRQVHNHVKNAFKTKPSKALLASGFVVLHFAMDADQVDLEDDVDDLEMWLHVSAVSWRPYKLCFSKLVRTSCPPNEFQDNGATYLE